MSANIVGTWDFASSENWEEYMKEVGVSFITRKAASVVKPTVIIENNGKEWRFQAKSTFKNVDQSCTEDVEFDEGKFSIIFLLNNSAIIKFY
jgi:hypothetical protein